MHFQVPLAKYAKRGNLEHSRAIVGQEWIAYDSSEWDGRIWRLIGLESARHLEN